MNESVPKQRRFLVAVATLALIYLGLQLFYCLRQPLAIDEFGYAYHVHRLMDEVPYRDYSPYKTVLGYYVQLPCFYLSSDAWTPMLLVRAEMALVTSIALIVAALMLAKHFNRQAVLLGIVLLAFTNVFMEEASTLRVDMMSAICGWIGLLLILRRRAGWAGVAAALSFFFSQKGVYYIAASEAALVGYWLLAERNRASAAGVLRFNVGALAVAATYVGFFSLLSMTGDSATADSVTHTTFQDSTVLKIALTNIYNVRHYWLLTLALNPLFYLAALAAIPISFSRRHQAPQPHVPWLLTLYGSALIALCLWHKQPFPYFFVMLVPTLAVLIMSLVDAMIRKHPERPFGMPRWGLVLVVVFGVIFPLGKPVREVYLYNNGFQSHMVRLADACLEEGDGYHAFFHLLYDRDQTLPELGWVDRSRARELEQAGPEELERLADQARQTRLKFYLFTYRVDVLPDAIRDHLIDNYTHMWGNLFVYAPTVPAGNSQVDVDFSGTYTLVADGPVEIDGRRVADGERIELPSGVHTTESANSFRLRFEPERLAEYADPKYRQPQPFIPYIGALPTEDGSRQKLPAPDRPFWQFIIF